MDKWTSAEWLAVFGIVVTAAAIVVGNIVTRRFGNRRGRLLVAYTTTRLLTAGAIGNHLQVTYRDLDVKDPHLVSLLLKNIGSNDITREQFEGGKFRIVLLKSRLYGLVEMESSDGEVPITNLSGGAGTEDAVMTFRPTLFPKGTEWTIEAIVSGPAEPTVRGRLVNTDIIQGNPASQTVLKALANISSLTFSTLLGNIKIDLDGKNR